MQKKFKKEFKSLDVISVFLQDFSKSNDIKNSLTLKLNLIVEEIVTNFVKYNSDSKNDILLKIEKVDNYLSINMTDFDVESFDVTQSKEPNIHKSLQERKIGGLGLHLVRQFAEKIDYEYKNRNSTIAIMLKLEN